MKKKTIHAVIAKKIKDWASSLPPELRDMAENNTIVTGGCIASMLLREKVNDFDLYFTDRATALAIAQHYVNRFKAERKPAAGIPTDIYITNGYGRKVEAGELVGYIPEKDADATYLERMARIKIVVKSAGIASIDDSAAQYEYFEQRPPEEAQDYVSEVMGNTSETQDIYEASEQEALENETPGYNPVFLSTNAITLSGKIQIIIRFWGKPDEIHENYDYVHCTNYWTKVGGLVLRQEALEAILARELRYIGSKYPICSLIRARKFIRRDWTINAGQFVKMAFQISKLDLENLYVLEEQLTGVDVAYFAEVIRKLQEKDKERVDGAYLLEILDRMF